MLKWATQARARGEYEYAAALCNFVIRHHPETKKAEAAAQELKKIAEALANDALKHSDKSPNSPETAAPEK